MDENRQLRDDSRGMIARLQGRYVSETGIKTLKVRHNNILGYFVEVTANAAGPLLKAPLNTTFRHRQTMANAVRLTTDELSAAEARITGAADRALAIEMDSGETCESPAGPFSAPPTIGVSVVLPCSPLVDAVKIDNVWYSSKQALEKYRSEL